MAPQLLFAVGASGVGKTAAVQALRARALPRLSCYHFDEVGVPSVDEMTRLYGSSERWQEITTREWIARLQRETDPLIILEGQTRPSFIRASRFDPPIGIVLLDCHPTVRSDRLRTGRQQPELDTPRMDSWAAYLRGQADALGLPVIDTTSLSPDEVAEQLYVLVQTVSAWATV